MKLRSQVEQGVLCCLMMTTLGHDQTLSTSSLAKIHDLPKAYLSKTLQALARAGIIVGLHGTHGGYRLAREPHSINLLEIVQAIEGEINTFVESGRVGKLVADAPVAGVASILKRSFKAADGLWQEVLATDNLESLAAELRISSAGWLIDRNQPSVPDLT